MTKFGIAPSPSGTRRKLATAFAAAGALLLSSGLAVAAAPGALAAPGDNNGKAVGADKGKDNKGKGNNNAGGQGNGNQGGGQGNGNQGGGQGNGNQGGNGNAGGGNTGGPTKYYVCKWVGTPDVNEAAHHLVQVPASPLHGEGYFNDKQGPSYVLPSNVPQEIGSCPRYGGPGAGPTASLANVVWTPNSCAADGFIRQPISDNVAYTIEDGSWDVTAGEYDVTATLQNGVTVFTGSTEDWSVSGTSATRTYNLGDDQVCADLAASADPIEKCGTLGSVTATDTDLVDYSVPDDKWTGLEGPVTVTATLQGGATSFTSTGEWNGTGSTVTRTFELGSYTKCTKNDDGKNDDGGNNGGTPGGNNGGNNGGGNNGGGNNGGGNGGGNDGEVLGEDKVVDKPTDRQRPAPANADAEVLGEQAVAVPTAVAAGLGDTMTAPSAIGGPQLAQALVAAGLLMLLAGGATGLGRRTRGAHES